jgi:hypothetical protein
VTAWRCVDCGDLRWAMLAGGDLRWTMSAGAEAPACDVCGGVMAAELRRGGRDRRRGRPEPEPGRRKRDRRDAAVVVKVT